MKNNNSEQRKEPPITKTWYILIFSLAAVFGLAGGAGAGWFFAARIARTWLPPPTNEIVVPERGFLFKTPEGKLIAKLVNGNDGGTFTIFNAEQRNVAELQSLMGGGQLTLWNDEGVLALHMTGNEDGGTFWLNDAKRGKNVIQMYPDDDGGTIIVNDGHGDSVVKLRVDRKGGKVETFASELKENR